MQATIQLFQSTRGGKANRGRCEVCNEVLRVNEDGLCNDCENGGLLAEETDEGGTNS